MKSYAPCVATEVNADVWSMDAKIFTNEFAAIDNALEVRTAGFADENTYELSPLALPVFKVGCENPANEKEGVVPVHALLLNELDVAVRGSEASYHPIKLPFPGVVEFSKPITRGSNGVTDAVGNLEYGSVVGTPGPFVVVGDHFQPKYPSTRAISGALRAES